MSDSFLKTHYTFTQIVKVANRGQAILDTVWTNMNMVYSKPVTVAELGTSDHNNWLYHLLSGNPCTD